MTSSTPTLDLTGGKLNVKINKNDAESFFLPLPAPMADWTFAATGGVMVEYVTNFPVEDVVYPQGLVVRIPVSVTSVLQQSTPYKITCSKSGAVTTLLSGTLFPT